MSKNKGKKNLPEPLPYERHDPPKPFVVALKPQPKLLAIVSVIFVLWVILLLVMYFVTVYPTRHS